MSSAEVADVRPDPDNLREAIERAINRFSAENGSNTPDFVLAEFLLDSLAAFDKATKRRDEWWQNRSIDGPSGRAPLHSP